MKTLLFACLLILSLRAHSQDRQKETFIQRIEAIKTEPLEILPVSDCRLTDIESEIFLAYPARNLHVPYDLQAVVARKRQQIDFMRIHIDSLYYIQALQALNQNVPDWKAAEEYTDKSLSYNRFFVKSVVLKMTYLLIKKNNAQSLLRYMNVILQECPYPQKIKQISQTSYNTLLKGTQDLIDNKLYQDALDLCQLLEAYCYPKFPIRYQSYREKLLRNLAHQGIYRSHCDVAEKAFSQKQYQFAQKYALQAFDYFNKYESHMNGVNHALELLDRIAMKYNCIAAVSDPVEKAFYLALVDTIVNRTGLVVSPASELLPEDELRTELEILNRPTEVEHTVEFKEKPVELQEAPKVEDFAETHLSPHQAQKQFNHACEQARNLNAKRQFAEAYAWFEQAFRLKKQYKLRTDADFEEEVRSTLLQTVEQLVNKAVFHLWMNEEPRADELYAKATAFFNEYRKQTPEQTAAISQLQQILDSYQEKRNESHCRDLNRQISRMQTDFYRQASYGNHLLAARDLQNLDSLSVLLEQPEFSACSENSVPLDNMRQLMKDWTQHKDSLGAAFLLQKTGDTVAFIEKYQQTAILFDSLKLGQYIPAEPTLFSRLSSMGDLRTLLIWAEISMKGKDWKRARFLIGYLSQQNYRTDYLNKLARPLRNIHE